jgi:hypothetical protein
MLLASGAASRPQELEGREDSVKQTLPIPLDMPSQVLERYDPSTRRLHLVGRNASEPVIQRSVHIPGRIELRAIPDTAVAMSYFYTVVNDTLWGAASDPWPIPRDRVAEINTIKIDLRNRAGRHLLAGFMLLRAPN